MKCEYCEGRGKVENGLVIGMDLKNTPYITCSKCNGTGRTGQRTDLINPHTKKEYTAKELFG